jgi:hypothetical protein
MSDVNILNYQAKSPAARSVEDLVGKIDSAKHQWDSFGAALSLSYKAAYEQHAKTLKIVEQSFKSDSSQLMYFLFAAFVAGATGGLAGMLIAPVLTHAGTYVARRMAAQTNRKLEGLAIASKKLDDLPDRKLGPGQIDLRKLQATDQKQRAIDAVNKQQKSQDRVNRATKAGETGVLEGTKEVGVKSVERLELEKFFAPDPPKPDDTFQPPETDPHKFDLIKRIEIGICASVLKENVRRFQMLADAGMLQPGAALEFYKSNMAGSFLDDQPDSKQIAAAASEGARKQAEVAMWIAWAAARNMEYWKIRLKGIEYVDRGIDYNDFREVKKYDPVFDRLHDCGVGHKVGMSYTVSREWGHLTRGLNGQVLSIPKLKHLGKTFENRFLRKVDNITDQRKMTLRDFEMIANVDLTRAA